MRNVLLTIAYDGTGFSGWQRQPGRRTVQGELERALSRICAEEVTLHGTSRTDAGVHALGQRASFSGDFGIPANRIPIAANALLEDIHILEAQDVPEGFHARFDAKRKTYFYRLAYEGPPVPDEGSGAAEPSLRHVFMRNYFYWLQDLPNIGKMEEAAKLVVGTHDFAAFQSAGGTPRETTVRTISELRVFARGRTLSPAVEEIDVEVTGDGFLYNMVRILVGTLVEIGLGQRQPEEAGSILSSRDRGRAGHTAPPQGLYLKEVFF
ncbi:MAG: tRNA pseudouridine(38-40) synthase TruA [Clostridiales Family XIII bacterium]|jgi:tRNA pseudouridine38-40 synthase|nr:tRNA pseudouridine(38-40) synthase TruA [Clostridiales Family XIII bacterium]